MEGKIRKIFPGANTANGSFNFFDNIIQNDINAVSHMVLAAASNNLDEDFLNYKLKQLE